MALLKGNEEKLSSSIGGKWEVGSGKWEASLDRILSKGECPMTTIAEPYVRRRFPLPTSHYPNSLFTRPFSSIFST